MEEPDIEGVATHDVPESCGAARKGGVEALTGVHASWVSSRETAVFPDADVLIITAGNTVGAVNARPWLVRRGRRLQASVEPSCARTGRSFSYLLLEGAAGRTGKAKAVIQ